MGKRKENKITWLVRFSYGSGNLIGLGYSIFIPLFVV